MMPIRARAPGKVVILGEYAVLAGAEALAMAVDRYCVAELRPSPDGRCRLETRFPAPRVRDFDPAEPSGTALVDVVITELGLPAARPAWHGLLDSSAFFAGSAKMGLGSSAAALCAWAAAWSQAGSAPTPGCAELIRIHRVFQGGAGSGIDVAAACSGGVVRYRLDAKSMPHVGSVQLPNSVGFAGIFAGHAASTPGLVTRYEAWVAEEPRAAAAMLRKLGRMAERGCRAAGENDGEAFVQAIDDYGRGLGALGAAMGASIVTAEHREIAQTASRVGISYKVSGAGGGDLGLAFATDPEKLSAFAVLVEHAGYRVLPLKIARQGLAVEELVD